MLIVEIGSNDASANTFADMAYIDAYHGIRGNVAWIDEADTAKRQAAVIRAFDYLSTRRWKVGVIVIPLPEKVKQAQAEGALRELIEPGVLQPDLTKDDFVVRKQIDVMDTIYADGAGNVFKRLDDLLRGLVWTGFEKRRRQLVRG